MSITSSLTVIVLTGNKYIMCNDACAFTWAATLLSYRFDLNVKHASSQHILLKVLRQKKLNHQVVWIFEIQNSKLKAKKFRPGQPARIVRADRDDFFCIYYYYYYYHQIR